jgi:predicted secreted hydrolase
MRARKTCRRNCEIWKRSLFFLGFTIFTGVSAVGAHGEPFSSASDTYLWNFPRDHGRHSSYATEWWYYTGQLYDAGKEPFRDRPSFGYQLTFFRRGSSVAGTRADEFMAHAALTDIERGKTFFAQRIGGGAFGAAGVSERTLRAWSGDWSADRIESSDLLRYSIPMDGVASWFVRLSATGLGEPWLQGEHGFSQKGECPGCASMYYSYPSLQITGSIESSDAVRPVTGLGWMDHEFMSNSLGAQQQGWDWLSLMLRDGRRVMLFQIRSTNGAESYMSGGVYSNGAQRRLTRADITMTPSNQWTSPRSHVRYPLTWRIVIPSEQIDVEVTARVADCEIGGASDVQKGDSSGARGAPPLYWEGPVATGDEGAIGYLEMTGYSQKIDL